MSQLSEKSVAILVENNYQEMEVWYPIYRFQEAGARVCIVGPEPQKYTSKLGYPVQAEISALDAVKMHFHAVVIPGGYAPDLMRTNQDLVALVRDHALRGDVVAAICHGSWMLASADVIRGKRVTGAAQIRDDLRNAGATVLDESAVRDGNLVTSRKPADIPAFCAAILTALSEAKSAAA
ncbi:MAG: type 1 glutamine amidotransferase domain-containing protein [Pseudomonadota bacterium]